MAKYNRLTKLPLPQQITLAVIGFVVLIAISLFIVDPQSSATILENPSLGWDFRNNLWGPSHLLLTGRSPYRIDQLFDGSNSVWLPQVIGALFPIGALPLPGAIKLWAVITVGCLFALVGLSQQRRPSPLVLGGSVLAVMLFPPTVSHLILGQYSILTVFLCLLISRGLPTQRILWLGLGIALTLVKPQLMVLALPGLCVGMLRAHDEKNKTHSWLTRVMPSIKLIFTAVGWCVLLTIPLWVAAPNWIEGLQWAFARNKTWVHPSTLEILRQWAGGAGTLLWVVLTGLAVVGTVWLWWRLPPPQAMPWTLALTLLVTPYVWSWDFVLLLPLLVQTLFRSRTLWGRSVWFIGYGAIWWSITTSRLNAGTDFMVDDSVFWWIPAAVMLLVGIVSWIERRQHADLTAPRD
jgi:hypothetical protein